MKTKYLETLDFYLIQKNITMSPAKLCSTFNDNYIQYQSIGDKDKSLPIKEYPDMMRPYLSGIINDHKAQEEWKIHLTRAIKFFSSKDSDETQIMQSKSDNIEIMIGNKTDRITEELFKSLLQR